MPAAFRVLLVDDDPLLIEILERASHDSFPEALFTQVYSAAAAQAYFRDLEGWGPRLVLLDLDLGCQQTGIDLLRLLRAHVLTLPLPVVILTVSQLKSDVQLSYSLGASSFTCKPDTFEAWKLYLHHLRRYWLETVTSLPIFYQKGDWPVPE